MARNSSALHNSSMEMMGMAAENSPSSTNASINSTPKSSISIRTNVSSRTPKTPLENRKHGSIVSTPNSALSKLTSTPNSAISASSTLSSPSSSRRPRKIWTDDEEALLVSAVSKHGEHWKEILMDSSFKFNERVPKDLKVKYRSLQKISSLSSSELASSNEAIFDIRTVNSQVTEVFMGSEWSKAQWISADEVQSAGKFEKLLGDFERKISTKQRLISRISPARTPSHHLAALSLNSESKRRRNLSEDDDSLDGPLSPETPLKKTKPGTLATLLSDENSQLDSRASPLRTALKVHSEDEDSNDIVYPEESEQPAVQKPGMMSRCVIM